MTRKKERRKKNNPKIVDTTSAAMSKGSARTLLGPKVSILIRFSHSMLDEFQKQEVYLPEMMGSAPSRALVLAPKK